MIQLTIFLNVDNSAIATARDVSFFDTPNSRGLEAQSANGLMVHSRKLATLTGTVQANVLLPMRLSASAAHRETPAATSAQEPQLQTARNPTRARPPTQTRCPNR